jgi:hypothetical protein
MATQFYDYDGHPAKRIGDRVTLIDPNGKEQYVKEMAKFSVTAYTIPESEYFTRVNKLRKPPKKKTG